jgi:hypothetical protein
VFKARDTALWNAENMRRAERLPSYKDFMNPAPVPEDKGIGEAGLKNIFRSYKKRRNRS